MSRPKARYVRIGVLGSPKHFVRNFQSWQMSLPTLASFPTCAPRSQSSSSLKSASSAWAIRPYVTADSRDESYRIVPGVNAPRLANDDGTPIPACPVRNPETDGVPREEMQRKLLRDVHGLGLRLNHTPSGSRPQRHEKPRDYRRSGPLCVCVSLALLCCMSFFGGSASAQKSNTGSPPEALAFRKAIRSKSIQDYSAAASTLRRFMRRHEPQLPLYHFTAPEGWINDPNGVIFDDGLYHLFYQFDPIVEGKRSARTWGHAVSRDLAHWQDWPVAIWPDSPWDRNGVFSGNIVIDDHGVPTALYTGNVRGRDETYGMQARSYDGMVTWTKKMVMHNRQRPNPDSPVHWDGHVWKDGQTWFQLVGGTTGGSDPKGAAYLWTSPDLDHWTLQKPIFTGPQNFWEYPYLLPFGNKYLFICGSFGAFGNPYWVGSYEKRTMTFTPDSPEPQFPDAGYLWAVNPNLVDHRGPGGSIRRIMFAWIPGKTREPWGPGRASPTPNVPWWDGFMAIPRVISLEGARLVQEPIPEIRALRDRKVSFRSIAVSPKTSHLLPNLNGDALEIIAVFKPGNAQRCGITVRASKDGRAGIPIWFGPGGNEFGVLDKHRHTDLRVGQPVRIHIFVDRAVTEVYVNGNPITIVDYLDQSAQGVGVFAEGGNCTIENLESWSMRWMWE